MLNILYNMNGTDKIGWRYTIRAVEMANEIQLFRLSDDSSSDTRCVWDYTAWLLFTWQRCVGNLCRIPRHRFKMLTLAFSLYSYNLQRQPLVKEPPQSPLPDPAAYPQWYGELWVKYPLGKSPLPTHHALLFKAKADLWTVVNDFSVQFFRDSDSLRRLSHDQVCTYYNKLVSWYERLPDPLTPRKITLPNQIKLHVLYNLLVMDLLKPFIGHPWILRAPHRRFPDQSPRSAFQDAMVRFETTLRLYYLRHGYETLDIFLMQFLGVLASLMMELMAENEGKPVVESLRSTLLLAAKGIWHQGQSTYVAGAVTRLLARSMRAEDVGLLRRYIKLEPAQLRGRESLGPIQSIWPYFSVGHERLTETLTWKMELLALNGSVSPGGGLTEPRTERVGP